MHAPGEIPMNRLLSLLLLAMLALVAWLALRLLQSEPGQAPVVPPVDAVPAHPDATAAESPQPTTAADAAAQRVEATAEAATDAAQPPIPEDSVWLDVRVVDADKRPVAGAEVRWSTNTAWQQITTLPEGERQDYYESPDRVAVRFGWRTTTGPDGIAKIAADQHGATVHATADGRHATGRVGGPRETPKDGWVLQLEPDLTLRVRVLDALGRPAIGAHVGIVMFDADGKELRNVGLIPPRRATAPDGLACFPHVQRWLRQDNGPKRMLDVARWQVAPVAAGVEGPFVAFDVDAPPVEPIELRLPPTGRLVARLLHEGQVQTKGVTFQSYRGGTNDTFQRNNAPRFHVDADGWARMPFAAASGEVVVIAHAGSADVTKVVTAPIGQDAEVRVELTTDELFCLCGRFVGRDGAPIANATVGANFDFGIMKGGASVTTDAQGRFVWLLTKGHGDTARITRLVFSQQFADEPQRSATVTPREIRRGNNDLGVLVLAPATVVVAGRIELDSPRPDVRVWFQIEALDERRGRNGEERWRRVDSLLQQQHEDGTFEVRGEARPARHRLVFPSTQHLPVDPVEFRLGQDDLVVPVAVGHRLSATCLLDERVPQHLLRGRLVPQFEPPTEPRDEGGWSPHQGRYRVDGSGLTAERYRFHWTGLPAGTYALEVSLQGLGSPLVHFDDVVLPLPAGGDPRLEDIDLRGRVGVVALQLERPAGSAPDRRGDDVLVFPMPQRDEQLWQGLRFHEDKLKLPVVPGPLDLMVLGDNCRPHRCHFTAEQVASGKLVVEYKAWPQLDLLVPGLPELPAGTTLHLFCSPTVPGVRDTRRFEAAGLSGGLEHYFQGGRSSGGVEGGRVTVSPGEGTFRLSACLRAIGNNRPQWLQTVTPGEVIGGDNQAPITVQLSADEIRAALEKLAAGNK